jgi:hypothetical protein
VLAALCLIAAISVEVRPNFFANEVVVIDELSQWSGSGVALLYVRAWDKEHPLSADEHALLKAYASIRSKRAESDNHLSAAAPYGAALAQGLHAQELFAESFLSAEGAAAALRSLPPNERKTLTAVFDALGANARALAAKWTAPAADEVKKNLDEARLAAIAKAFGAARDHYTVHLAGAPEGGAVVLAGTDRVLVATDGKKDTLTAALAAREFSRACLGARPLAEREQLTNQALALTGLTRRRHDNIAEEAMLTALGLWVAHAPPDADEPLAPYEPNDEYPYAVDAMARELLPSLDALVPQGAQAIWNAAVTLTAVPQAVSHFTHLGPVLTESKELYRWFRGSFWSVSRSAFGVPQAAAFLKEPSGPLARWFLTTPQAQMPMANGAHVPELKKLALTTHAACLEAVRRGGDGYDFYYLVRDERGLRETLPKVAELRALPTSTVCF